MPSFFVALHFKNLTGLPGIFCVGKVARVTWSPMLYGYASAQIRDYGFHFRERIGTPCLWIVSDIANMPALDRLHSGKALITSQVRQALLPSLFQSPQRLINGVENL